MEQKRILLIGSVAFVMSKVKNAGEAMVAVWKLQPEVRNGLGFLAKRMCLSDDSIDAKVYAVDRKTSEFLYYAEQQANTRRIK